MTRAEWRTAIGRHGPALVVLAAGALWISHYMNVGPWWWSHENLWYPIRVREYLESWRGGGYFPRWCPDFRSGYGYPFFNYYAPGVYVAGAAIAATGIAPTVALKLVMAALSVVSGGGAYGLAYGETRRRDAAFLGAATWVFCPYRTTDLLTRGDLAEFSAYALLPFVVWAYRAIGRAPAERRGAVAFAAALAHAAVLLTHPIVGMFTTEGVGLYVLVALIRQRRGPARPALVQAAACGVGIVLSAIYTLPAMVERHFVHLERVTGGRFVSWKNTVKLRDLISEPLATPGLAFALCLALWGGALAWPRTRGAAWRATPWFGAALGLLALLIHWARPLWHVLPFGAEVQFPWRLLGGLGLFAAVGTALAWSALASALPRAAVAVAIAVVALLPVGLAVGTRLEMDPAEPVADDLGAIRALDGTSTAMNEYEPVTVLEAPPARGDLVTSETPGARVRGETLDGLHHAVVIDADGEATVRLAVFQFPGWALRTTGGADGATLATGRDGLMRIHVPRAGHYEVEVGFGTTGARTLAAALSALALLLGYPALRWWSRRRFVA